VFSDIFKSIKYISEKKLFSHSPSHVYTTLVFDLIRLFTLKLNTTKKKNSLVAQFKYVYNSTSNKYTKINKDKTMITVLWVANEFVQNMNFFKMRNKLDAELIKMTLLTPKHPKYNFSIRLISTIAKHVL
jgi:chromatin remodeling complex protein RSC6